MERGHQSPASGGRLGLSHQSVHGRARGGGAGARGGGAGAGAGGGAEEEEESNSSIRHSAHARVSPAVALIFSFLSALPICVALYIAGWSGLASYPDATRHVDSVLALNTATTTTLSVPSEGAGAAACVSALCSAAYTFDSAPAAPIS